METQKTLEFKNASLQSLVFIGPLIDMFLGPLPLLGKTTVVLQNHLLDGVCDDLEVLVSLFAFLVNLGNLGAMGPPLSFSIIHL